MKRRSLMSPTLSTLALTLPLVLALGCGDDSGADADADGETTGSTTGGDADFPLHSCEEVEGNCIQVTADDEEGLQVAANSLVDGDTLILGLGVFELDNQVTIRGNNITVWGQGKGTEGSMDEGTILDFMTQAAQSNGLDAKGDGFAVADLAVIDAKKDGIRIEDSDGVTIQRVRVTWRNESDSTNGAYGIYPVKVSHVLMEDSEAYNTADAGIYVGQCRHAIVRNNIAKKNVAGIEIENTQYADVYGNLAEDNTGGLVVFDLPGNPVIGHDIKIHDNMVIDNNRANFAPGGTVREIPPGTGTFAMASRRVEIYDNTYADNGTIDIALISGLAIEADPQVWALEMSELVGDLNNTDVEESGTQVFNYRTDDIYVHDNEHSGSGLDPTQSTGDQQLGILLALVYGGEEVDEIVYDAIGESAFDPTDTDGSANSNDNHICLMGNAGATFAGLGLDLLLDSTNPAALESLYRPASPFAPFDCMGFTNGDLVDPEMGG